MRYEDITKEILEKYLKKEIVWFKQNDFFPEYVRVHFDDRRYLSHYQDVKMEYIK